ncbi:MAG: hypothetical protein P4L46_21315 [Fimbriimonas sp.]|nr:hypothetical protein [Fimbriimonas sp.]
MGRLGKGLIGAVIVSALPVAANAQAPFALDSNQTQTQKTSEVGGTPAMDVITLNVTGPGTPLRYGNIVPNSESVQLDGVFLKQGTDYMMDYAVGVVYLMVSQRSGQVLTVSYHYKAGAAPAQSSQFAGFTTFKYSLLPGSLNMITGLGMAERGENGSVMSSNLYGWNNAFKFGQSGSVNGMYIVDERQQVNNIAGLGLDSTTARAKSSIGSGNTQLIMEGAKTSFMGGQASIDYQDISKSFTGFNAAATSGLDDKAINQLKAERGLNRLGFSMTDMSLGGMKLSDSYKTVKDGENGIKWTNFGVANKDVKFNWSSQRVDQHFMRSNDLSEADKAQLAKETGINRNNMSGEWTQKFAKLNYANNTIVDAATHKQISQSTWALDAGKYKFNMGSEAVDSGFMRFGSLLAPEMTTFGREAGVNRKWLGFQGTFLGKDTPVSFNQTNMTSSTGAKYLGQDVTVTSKAWSLNHVERKADLNFSQVGALPDAEINNGVAAIAAMYGPDVKPTPNDRAEFIATHGLDRKYDGFTDTFKGIKLNAGMLSMKGMTDAGKLDTFAISSKNMLLSYRRENLGAQFNEITSMMDVEKSRLGTLPGLKRTDIDFSGTFGKRKLTFDNMNATTLTGNVARTSLGYEDTKISIQANQRNVSSAFADANNLVDPEKNILNQLIGFHEKDVKVKWQLMSNMNLDSTYQDMVNPVNNQSWRIRNNVLNWSPDKNTQINYTDIEQHNSDSVLALFDSSVEKLSLTRNMGRYGVLTLLGENDQYSGINANLLSQNHDYVAYDAKLTTTTSFKTEQTLTTYANGSHDEVNANTLSTQLSNRAGVSFTDTQINRQGYNDETHRNYGFYYDLGNGVRMSYGYAMQGLPKDQGTSSSSFTLGKAPPATTALTPGQVQPVQAGDFGNFQLGAGYFANQWDAQNRTQTNGNVSVVTAKPFNLGFVKNVKMALNMDTGTDHAAVMRENKLIGVSGTFGTNTIGYEYKSQLDPTGLRAIDRTVTLQTDPSDKKLVNVTLSYKDRTTTTDQQILIRNYSFAIRPVKNFVLTNQVQTNPEIANASAILGSLPQASSSDKWQLDYKQNPNFTIGGSFEELLNSQTRSMSRTGGITAKLFEKVGSPLTLFVGVEQADQANLWRNTRRWSIQFDQKPASNQTLSFLVGSLSYEHSIPVGYHPENMTVRMNYQFRF